MHTPAAELLVHDDAIRANTATFVRLTGGKVMAVLKADAFGHGAIAQSVLEAGASAIGVTSVAEALALRATGVTAPMLCWLNPVDADFAGAILADIDLAVSHVVQLNAVAHAAARIGRRARVHLHIDVGMARDGCPRPDWRSLCALAREQEAVGAILVVGIMGHLSCADAPEDPQNRRELLHFENAVRSAYRRGLGPVVRHVAATAATLGGIGNGFELHRIGAGLVGIDPSGSGIPLSPALSLTAKVVSARSVSAHTGVGYGLDFVAERGTNLALIPVGYGDGLPRSAGTRAEVFVRDRRRPVVGRISMDMIVVDTGDDLLRPGERVTLFGPGSQGEPTVAQWAEWSGTIEHEIVTRLGSRVSRVHRSHEPQAR